MTENETGGALTLATLTNEKGEQTTAVLGSTYDAKLILAAHGGKYDQNRKFWTFADPNEAGAAVAVSNRYFAMRAARRGGSA
jgi:hypothetical protein